MDIGVGGIRGKRVHQRVEVIGRNVLSRDRYDVVRCPRACHSAAIQRARRGDYACGAITQVCAKEHKDATGVAALAEMDMSLSHRARERRRRAHVRIGQLVGDDAGRLIEIERCRARAVGQDRPGVGKTVGILVGTRYLSDFVEPGQVRNELLGAGVVS